MAYSLHVITKSYLWDSFTELIYAPLSIHYLLTLSYGVLYNFCLDAKYSSEIYFKKSTDASRTTTLFYEVYVILYKQI